MGERDAAVAMTATVTAPGLRTLTLEQLGDAWQAGAVTFDQARAECDRRDRSERARAGQRKRYAGWYDAAWQQYVHAEAYCSGNMLSPAGQAAGIKEAMRLWYGDEERALRYASRELREFWLANGGRMTPGQWEAQKRAGEQAEREFAGTLAIAAEAPSLAARAAVAALSEQPAPVAGTIARYTSALTSFTDQADALTARLLATIGAMS